MQVITLLCINTELPTALKTKGRQKTKRVKTTEERPFVAPIKDPKKLKATLSALTMKGWKATERFVAPATFHKKHKKF